MDEDGFALASARVGIVGLGLMGASLALDLHGRCAELVGVSRTSATLDYALAHGIVDRTCDFEAALDCDLLVLAAPVRTILRQLEQMASAGANADHRTVVLDLGSTKQAIVRAMQALPARFDPVGSHPMCGKEVAGIRNAEAGLYRGRTFILTPLERTSPAALALVKEVLSVIGARPLVLTPDRQDSLVALTSHLPYLAACSLMEVARADPDEVLWQVAASGFRDTSRLAASDLEMMIDILLTNREAILRSLEAYRSELAGLAALLAAADEAGLRAALTPVQQQRAGLFRQAKE